MTRRPRARASSPPMPATTPDHRSKDEHGRAQWSDEMGACVPPTVMTAANVAMERRRFPRCTNGAGAPSPIDPQVPSPSPRLARIQRFRRRGERARRAVRDAHLAARPPVWRAFAARARPFQSRRSPDRFAPLPPPSPARCARRPFQSRVVAHRRSAQVHALRTDGGNVARRPCPRRSAAMRRRFSRAKHEEGDAPARSLDPAID